MTDLRAAAQQAEPVAWLRVIDEAMVTHHLGVADPADDYETAKRKMNNLLCHAQDIGAYFASEQQAEPVVFDPAEAMRLADDYASAQSELDGEHSINRQYYVKGRDEARAELAAYLGIKERT